MPESNKAANGEGEGGAFHMLYPRNSGSLTPLPLCYEAIRVLKLNEKIRLWHWQRIKNAQFVAVQHGFIKGKSCVTQLLEFIEEVTESIDRGDEVDVIYLDFYKAFDKVPHRRLLEKVEGYGIRGKILH
ncbi:MAG: hypothetical protein AB2693_21205 [Candidatus Thiodiazotropha sp.]